jgi:hypothetical protein
MGTKNMVICSTPEPGLFNIVFFDLEQGVLGRTQLEGFAIAPFDDISTDQRDRKLWRLLRRFFPFFSCFCDREMELLVGVEDPVIGGESHDLGLLVSLASMRVCDPRLRMLRTTRTIYIDPPDKEKDNAAQEPNSSIPVFCRNIRYLKNFMIDGYGEFVFWSSYNKVYRDVIGCFICAIDAVYWYLASNWVVHSSQDIQLFLDGMGPASMVGTAQRRGSMPKRFI